MVVRVLSAKTLKAHSFTYPLRTFRGLLQDLGIEVHIHHRPSDRLYDADVVCLTTEAFAPRRLNPRPPEKEAFVARVRDHVDTVLWFDTAASTGCTSFQVLPYVDLYAKSHLYADTSLYTRARYSNRIWSEYYHAHHGVEDPPSMPSRRPAAASDLCKLAVSWNLGLGDYSSRTPSHRRLRILLGGSGYADQPYPPGNARDLDVSCRVSTDYRLSTVGFHRRVTVECLKRHAAARPYVLAHQGKLSYLDYVAEQRRSRVVASPFGSGEVCIRDFECFLGGAALLKPEMHHVNTWPDYYEAGVTYQPYAWDFEDIPVVLDALLSCEEHRMAIATNGQRRFAESRSEVGGQRFAEHLLSLLKRAETGSD